MSNQVQGVIDAKLADGRTIKLLFDFNTWVEAEELTGLDMKVLIDQLRTGSISAKNMRSLFWCAMKEHQPEITEREAGSILTEAASAMRDALGASMPQADEEEAGEDRESGPPLSATGTGTSS